MNIEFLLKKIREERGMSLNKLSERSGISASHINDIERSYKMPSLFVMVKLAKALDVNITELYKVKW